MSPESKKFLPHIPVFDPSEGTELFIDFSQEAQRHLISARNSLLVLETIPTDKEALESIFKTFHTIKGLADFLGLQDIHCLTLETEIMLNMVRKNHLSYEEGAAPLTTQAVNSLQKLLELLDEQIANGGTLESSYPNAGKLIMAMRDFASQKPTDEKLKKKTFKPIPMIHFEPDMSSCTQIEEKLKTAKEALTLDKKTLQKLITDFQETGRKLSETQSKLVERQRELIKERELAIKLTQQAQTEAKTKSEYLANMSHEIRTLINAILGFTDLLKDSALSNKQAEHVETIVLSGNMLLRIVNDILDFSKVEAGKLKLEKTGFGLRDAVEEVFRIIRTRLNGKSINLYFDVEDNIQNHLIGDPVRLKQIFINLLDNAIKFTESGEIGLTVKIDPQQKTFPGQCALQFVVADTGIGIPEDRRSLIFESFTQASDSTTRLYGGSGLGLTLCKTFVEKMGGEIRVESESGKGSKFIFTLKLQEQEGELKAQPRVASPLSDFSGMEIMAVDGYESSFRALASLCKENRMKISPNTRGARQALEFLRKREADKECSPAIIFIDVMLPDKEGFMLAYKIRQQERYQDIKLVAVSCDAKVDSTEDFKQAQFDSMLVKPLVKSEVTDMILRLLNDEAAGPRAISQEMIKKISCEGVRILIVEDSLPNQELLKAYFESLECVCDYASNGKEAIAKLKDKSYDICFMDLQMPVMGGLEATKIIRQELKMTLPIVALTAAEVQEDKEKCLNIGMNDYLSKPFGLNELKEKIIRCTKM